MAVIVFMSAKHHSGSRPDSRARSRVSDGQIFRILAESVHGCGVYSVDPDGHVAGWNQGMERLTGYPAAEIIGRHYGCFFTPEEQQAGKPQKALRTAAQNGSFDDECWMLRKDGSRFWAGSSLTAIRNSKHKLIGFARVTQDLSERMQARDALHHANAQLAKEIRKCHASERHLADSQRSLREVSLRLLRAQDEERRRIGRELHDTVAQYLAMLKMHLESVDLSPGRPASQMAAQIAQCARLADDSLKEVRTASHLMYPPTLEDLGLKSAIPWYLDGFSRRSGIHTTLEIDADFPRLENGVEVALFRVLQESLTNVHRHSGSNRALIRLYMRRGRVTLEIQDAGKGMPAELLEHTCKDWLGAQGVGLRGMRERMHQLGGDLLITSDQHGTQVRAVVPVEAAVAASQ